MAYFAQPVLLMFLGVPGSGKSYFAKGVSKEMNAIRINGDSMRMAIFGSREETNKLYADEKNRYKLNSYVFNGLDYVAEQILLTGRDVVYDAHHNTKKDRDNLAVLARKYNALPLVVSVETPVEVAVQRGQDRDETVDQRKMDEQTIRETIARHQAYAVPPTEEELVVHIDGLLSFDDQFTSFTKQVAGFTRGAE